MAAKIVHQMKEKMQLAGQTALLASMIPKRDGPIAPASGKPLAQMMSAQAKESTQTPGGGDDVQDGYVTANLHLPLALRKQRRPNAGLKPHHPFVTRKLKKANTVKQLKDELRNQQVKSQQNKMSVQSAIKNREERKKKLKMKHKLKQAGRDHVDSFRKKKMIRSILRDGKTTNDCYCWICHKEGTNAICQACPRVFHRKCIQTYPHDSNSAKPWFCPECEAITYAECADTQSKSLSLLSDDDLMKLLQCALNRMKHSCSGPFLYPVSQETAPNYLAYIFNPMDLTTIEKNVNDKVYGSPEAFLADVKWIAHNCIIYNGSSNKLTKSAQLIAQIAEHEIKEVQLCPDCYLFSCSKKKNWFCFPCRTMHTLVWAKLKGFPFWPAKVLREKDGRLDVRFFGQHDRAWVLVQDCYLISKEMPFPPTNNKTSGLSQAVREVEIHMQMIRDQRRKCEYAPFRTPYDVNRTYAHRNAIVTKNESAAPRKGKKRKRKGVIKKATYIPVLRDLDPPSQESMDVDVEDVEDEDKEEKSKGSNTEQSLKSEKLGSQDNGERKGTKQLSGDKCKRADEEGGEESNKQYGTDGKGKGLKNVEGGKRVDSAEGDIINEKEKDKLSGSLKEDVCKEDRLLSHPKQPLPEGEGKKMQGELVSSRVSISRKVYSRSGKVLELGSNISQEVGTVVEGGTLEQGEQEKEKKVESREGEAGKIGVDSSSGTGKESTDGTPGEVKMVPQSHDDAIVKSAKETDNLKLKENSGAPETIKEEVDKEPVVLKSESSVIGSPASTSKSAEVPLSILPNKLPDPKKLEVKTEQLSPKVTESTGTQVTPQKTDRFNEKLNETIKSCRKFLGLESESNEKPLDSDDESEGKSEQDSELDSSQDEDDGDKVDSEEGGTSRRATPSSLAEWDSPMSGVSSRKASLGFDSDSEDDTTDKELVIDEDGGNASGAEVSKEDDKQERRGSSERLSSPKLMIKLPFGSKGRQSLSDAGSKKDDDEEDIDDDDDFDGDKEIAGDEGRGKASEVSEAVFDPKGVVVDKKEEVEEMETEESKKEKVSSLEKEKITVEVAEYDDDDDDDVMEEDTVTLEGKMEEEEVRPEKKDSAECEERKDQVTAGSSKDVKVEPASEAKLSEEGESKVDAKLKVVGEKAEVKVMMDSEKTEAEVTTVSTEGKNEEVICVEDGGKVEEPIDVVVKDILKEICEKVEETQERSPSEDFDKKLAELEAKVDQLGMKLMIERQEALEKKAAYELMVYEIFENYQVLIKDTVSRLTKEHETEMLDVKRKQWCAYCQKEAVFFCCWNTSYCDYPCQQKHWALHQRVCQQTANTSQSGTSTTNTTATNSSITTNPLQVSQVISGPQVPMDQLGQVQQRPPAVSNLIQYVSNVPKIFVPMQHSQGGQTLHMPPSQGAVATQNLRMGPPSVTGTAPQSFHVTPSQVTGGGQNIHMGPPHMQPPPLPSSVQTSPPQMLSQHQYRPMASQYQQNSQGPTIVNMPPPGSIVRQRMSDGKEVILHIPQNIRLSVPT